MRGFCNRKIPGMPVKKQSFLTASASPYAGRLLLLSTFTDRSCPYLNGARAKIKTACLLKPEKPFDISVEWAPPSLNMCFAYDERAYPGK
jgi:hypothetical protein